MKKAIVFITAILLIQGCNNFRKGELNTDEKASRLCTDGCKAGNKSGIIACKLTSPELQKRRATVIAGLKAQMTDKKELKDGYAFKFPGNDKMVDELTEFIKTERECCSFFTFNLSLSGDKSEVWLALTGPEGAKGFIASELAM